MEIKINIPLIGRLTGIFQKEKPPENREETTEVSVQSGIASWYYKKMKMEQTRLAKYTDYELMDDEYPEVGTCLDLYADNSTKELENGQPFEVKSDNKQIQNCLDELISRTKLYDTAWDTIRNMAKRGDDMDEVIVDEEKNITKLKNLEAKTMFKEVDEYGRTKDPAWVQKEDNSGTTIAEFEDWQILQWKNGGLKSIYGEAILKSVRRVYKQLQMMEDGLVIGRLTRSHLRYKFLVDVEGMSKEEAIEHLKMIKKEMRKRRLMNPTTGRLEVQNNPLSAEEDFFLGVTNDSKADIGVLQGATNLGNIKDVEYFQTKLFAGLKVPKAFVGLEKDVKAKATIVEEDIQFARTVARLRKGYRLGLQTLFSTQLVFKGIPHTLDDFTITFCPISMVDELRKWTIEKLKAEICKIYAVDMGALPDEFIYKHFMGLTDDEIKEIEKMKKEDEAKEIESGKKKAKAFGLPGPGQQPPMLPGGRNGKMVPTSGKQLGGLQQTNTRPPAVALPSTKATAPKAEAINQVMNGRMVTVELLELLETLRDIIDLELDR